MLDISDISYTMGISWELDSMKFLGLMGEYHGNIMLISWTHDNGNIGLILREHHGPSSENVWFLLTHRSLDFPWNQWRCLQHKKAQHVGLKQHWNASSNWQTKSNSNWNVTNETGISLTYINIWKCGFNQTELELQLNIHGCVWKRGIQYNMVLSFCKKMIFNHLMCFVSWPTHIVLEQLSKCVVALVNSWRLASDS